MSVGSPSLPVSLQDRATARASTRRRRDAFARRLAGVGASVLLMAITAIPLFLGAETLLAASTGPDWAWLLVLLAGTAKATVAALIVALPLALGAAIHVATHASQRWRERLRSTMEALEALPSVVIGLIAAIWLAPHLKRSGVVLLLAAIIVGVVILILARVVSMQRRSRWAGLPLALLPLPLLALMIASQATPAAWLWQPVNPWNAVLVGIAMGLANVPMLFNLAEAALRDVAVRHGQAALALGARPLQLVMSLLLPMATPALIAAGIVTAARCSGETMIVLMASANTPLLSADIFDGLRSLAAELALGLPVAEPYSSAYARLLKATFLLFVISFTLDAIARHVRRRHDAQEDAA